MDVIYWNSYLKTTVYSLSTWNVQSVFSQIQSLTPRLSTKNNIFREAGLNQLYSKVEYFIVVELVYIANKI